MLLTLVSLLLVNDVRLSLAIQAHLLFLSNNVIAVKYKASDHLNVDLLGLFICGLPSDGHVVGVLRLAAQAFGGTMLRG